jgi:hypothetical protein
MTKMSGYAITEGVSTLSESTGGAGETWSEEMPLTFSASRASNFRFWALEGLVAIEVPLGVKETVVMAKDARRTKAAQGRDENALGRGEGRGVFAWCGKVTVAIRSERCHQLRLAQGVAGSTQPRTVCLNSQKMQKPTEETVTRVERDIGKGNGK